MQTPTQDSPTILFDVEVKTCSTEFLWDELSRNVTFSALCHGGSAREAMDQKKIINELISRGATIEEISKECDEAAAHGAAQAEALERESELIYQLEVMSVPQEQIQAAIDNEKLQELHDAWIHEHCSDDSENPDADDE